MDSEQVQLNLAATNSMDLINEVLMQIRPLSHSRTVPVALRIKESPQLNAASAVIFVDSKKLQLSLRNLVTYAIESANPGTQVEVLMSIRDESPAATSTPAGWRIVPETPQMAARRGTLVIKIHDNISVPVPILNIGTSTHQDLIAASPAGVDGFKINGMGLWVAKKLIERHGGSVTVRQRWQGVGSTTLIKIPFSPLLEQALGGEGSRICNSPMDGQISSVIAGYLNLSWDQRLGVVAPQIEPEVVEGCETSTYGIVQIAEGSPMLSCGAQSLASKPSSSPLRIPQSGKSLSVRSEKLTWSPSSKGLMQLPPLKMLLVDDSATTLRVMKKLMQSRGHSCETACNGAEGVETFRAHLDAGAPFDIVLLDNCMPVMTGPECAAALRALLCTCPIIGVTGHSLQEDIDKFKEDGADEVILKPLVYESFVGVLNTIQIKRSLGANAYV
jgi:CheY-like chemotaxis protein